MLLHVLLCVATSLPLSARTLGQYKSAQTLYDAVVARYSSPATAALSRLILPYLFPDLSAFPTVADLITHLRTSDTRYRNPRRLPAEFCAKNPPPFGRARRLPLVGDAALARARGARARVELEGAVEVAVEAAEGAGVAAGVVEGVVVVVVAAAAEAAEVAAAVVVAAAVAVEAVEGAEEEAVVAEGVELVGVVPSSGAAVVWSAPREQQQQQRPRDIPPPQQLREWAGVAIFDLDFDAILAAMYAVTISEEGDCYPVFPRPTRALVLLALGACEAVALGASASAPSGTGETALSGSCVRPSCGTTVWATPPCPVFGAWLPVSLSLVFPSLSLPFLRGQDLPVSPVSRGASGLLLTPPSSPRQRLLCRHFTWTCGAQPPSVGQGHERYFLLVVDDYSRYTKVLPLRSKGAVTEVLIDWIREARLQLRRSFGSDFPVLRLHSDRGGEFSSRLLRDYSRAWGIRQTFTLPDSPQQNGIAERTHWHGHGCRSLAMRLRSVSGDLGRLSRDLSADKLSPRAAPCIFLGFPPDAPGWQFYHPSSRHVLSSQTSRSTSQSPSTASSPTALLPFPRHWDFLVPVPPPVDPLPLQVPAPSGVSQVDAVDPPGGATAEGAGPGGAEPGGAVPGAAELGGAGSGAAEPGGATSGATEPGGAARVVCSPLEAYCRSWSFFDRRGCWCPPVSELLGPASPTGAGAAGGVGAETPAFCPGGGSAAGAAGGPAAEGAGAVPAEPGAAARPRPYFVPLLEQVLGLSPPVECPQPVQSQSLLEPSSPLPAPSPYTGPTGGLAERREPASRPASPVRAARASGRGSRQRPPPVPGTHRMSLRPSTSPLRAPLPSPPESSLPALADPESDSLRAASPIVTRLLAIVVTDPSFESTAASALVAELVDFAARCRLDYAASLVAESASVCPPSVGGECALGTDVLEDRQEELQCLAAASPHLASVLLAPEGDPDALDIPTPRSYAEAVEGPYSSQWKAAMDAEMASWKSTGTYVDAVPPPGANIVSGMWIFRVKRPPGSPPVFKARYVARGFSQRQGVDYFQTFSPTPKMTTLRVLLHIAAQRDYELHSLDFSTAFLQGSLHEEIWLRRPPGFTGTFPPGTQWSLRRPVYGLRQAPRKWHDTLRTTLAALGFAPSTADPSLFLRTDTTLPPFYILVYVDDLVFATADTAGLAYVKSELLKRHTCTDLGELHSYLCLQITRDRARRTLP
ncbi:unnamed protein product [Closterium sp. NIES-65]|nr:unnamed protein product [Closterium sp. NIES-65]